MKSLTIGQVVGGKAFTLPLDAAVQTFAFIARKGAGKSYAAGKLVEEFADHNIQCIILDSVGNWYGLRIAADGKGRGLDMPVLGGLRGDIPLEASAGALIADVAVDSGRSLIIDVSQFSKADRQRFATAFGQQLWKRKKAQASPTPIHLFIEESQLIVPQKLSPDQGVMYGVYEEIIRLGRNYGVGVTMITQRPQSVNKEVLNMTECLFVLQVNGSQERQALKDWIVAQGLERNLVDQLPGLPIGTAFVWSPQWLRVLEKVEIGKKRTYDSTATPRAGQIGQRAEIKPLDMDDLKSKMAATIEHAKANDPAELKRKIADLQKQLAAKPAAPPPAAPKVVEKPVLREADLKRLEALCDRIDKAHATVQATWNGQVSKALADAGKVATDLRAAMNPAATTVQTKAYAGNKISNNFQPQTLQPNHSVAVNKMVAPRRTTMHHSASPGSGDLPRGEKATLTAIAQHPNGVTRTQLTILTGYKRSTRDAYVQRLRERGHIEDGDRIRPTESGIDALGSNYEPLPTGHALLQHWLNRLPEGERVVLEVITEAHPDSMDRERISEHTNYKRSTRDAYIQRLEAKELVITGRDGVRAADELFGE